MSIPEIPKKSPVQHIVVSSEFAGQRIDNFLITYLKGMPKSHIYRVLRKGEVRVNKHRVQPLYRLEEGDDIRLPPLFMAEVVPPPLPGKSLKTLLASRILYEDKDVLVINKISGVGVHGGNTVKVGIVEALRHMYPHFPQLELAHRLDLETSGCLIFGKKKKVLRELHSLLRAGEIHKIYWALTKGTWQPQELRVDLALHKHFRKGEKHVVEVNAEGKPSLTVFRPLQVFHRASLMEATLHSGRTHQIRVHAQHQGHPVAGDDRYGDTEFNKWMRTKGLNRLFLHARAIDFILPSTGQRIKVVAPLDPDLETCLQLLSDNS